MDLFTAHSNPSLFTTVGPCIATARGEPYHHNRSCRDRNYTPDSEEIKLQIAFRYHILHLRFIKRPQVPGPVDSSDLLRFRLGNPVWNVLTVREERRGAIASHCQREESILAVAGVASNLGVGRVRLAAAVVPSQGAHLS